MTTKTEISSSNNSRINNNGERAQWTVEGILGKCLVSATILSVLSKRFCWFSGKKQSSG